MGSKLTITCVTTPPTRKISNHNLLLAVRLRTSTRIVPAKILMTMTRQKKSQVVKIVEAKGSRYDTTSHPTRQGYTWSKLAFLQADGRDPSHPPLNKYENEQSSNVCCGDTVDIMVVQWAGYLTIMCLLGLSRPNYFIKDGTKVCFKRVPGH